MRVLWAVVACLGWAFAQSGDDLQRFDRLISAGQYAEALPALEAYVVRRPDSPDAQYQLGYVYYRLHRIEPSVKALSASLAMRPNHANAHRVLGYDLTILHRPDLAEREFRRAVELEPQSPETHYALGRVYYERGAYGQSASELELAIHLAPAHFKAHQSLGLAYEALNEIVKAREHLAKAAELNETQPVRSEWPYINLAAFLNRRGEYERAAEFARSALAVAPHSDAARFQAAKAYRGLGKWSDCVRELQAAIEIDASNPEFFYTLAVAYRRVGLPEKARAATEQFDRLKTWEATSRPRKNAGEPE